MSDKFHRHMFFPVKFLFEREDDQHQIDELPYRFHSRFVPCPNLRAYIINDLHVISFRNACKPKIKSRIINKHENIRTFEFDYLFERSFHGFYKRQMLQNFKKAHKAEISNMIDDLHACVLHFISAHAVHIDARLQAFKFPHNAGTVQIAGSFSRYDHHTLHRFIV